MDEFFWMEREISLKSAKTDAEHPAFALERLMQVAAKESRRWPDKLFFRLESGAQKSLTEGETLFVRLIIPSCDDETVADKAVSLLKKCLERRPDFELLDVSKAEFFTEETALESLLQKEPALREARHLCLLFSSPVSCSATGGYWEGDVDAQDIAKMLAERMSVLFSCTDETLEDWQRWEPFEVNAFHWNACEIKSRPVPRSGTQTVSGFVGPVWISGDVRPILSALATGARLGAGKDARFGMGAFEVLPAYPMLDLVIRQESFWQGVWERFRGKAPDLPKNPPPGAFESVLAEREGAPHGFLDMLLGFGLADLLKVASERKAGGEIDGWISDADWLSNLIPPGDVLLKRLVSRYSQGDQKESVEKRLRRPCYFTHPGASIGLCGGEVVGRYKGERIGRAPLGHVSMLILMGCGSVSVPLLLECSKREIPVALCAPSGKFESIVAPTSAAWRRRGDAHLRLWDSLNEQGRLAIAKALVTGKILSHLAWLSTPALRSAARTALHNLQACNTPDEVMGTEGMLASLCFREIDSRLKKPFFFSRTRIPHERRDPWNCLLDSASFLVHSRLCVLLHSVGLSPYRGVLHRQHDRYATFAADLQELFRARTERFLFGLVNQGLFHEAHFSCNSGAWSLNQDGWKALRNHFEKELCTVRKGDGDSWRVLMEKQVAKVVAWVDGKESLAFYYNGRWNNV